MNTMTLTPPLPLSTSTAAVSEQGARFARTRVVARSQISESANDALPTLEGRLANALRQATDVVRESIRDLGEECAGALIARITDLLHPEEWEEEDGLLKVGSVRTLVRTLNALDIEPGSIALTHCGNLAVSWADNGRKLRVECLPEGRVSWASIQQDGNGIQAAHKHGDLIANLRPLFDA